MAVDALFIQTGGTGVGSFNERWAQPDELGSYTQTKFPIRYETTTDPITGKRDGLAVRIPPGLEPKILEIDTESEYYDRGRADSLRHVSIDGGTDLPDPPNVRIFLLAVRDTALVRGRRRRPNPSNSWSILSNTAGRNARCWSISTPGCKEVSNHRPAFTRWYRIERLYR